MLKGMLSDEDRERYLDQMPKCSVCGEEVAYTDRCMISEVHEISVRGVEMPEVTVYKMICRFCGVKQDEQLQQA